MSSFTCPCRANNTGWQSIDNARTFLAGYFERTPLVRARSLSAPGREVFLKDETVLPTGSFKVRGALMRPVGRAGPSFDPER